MKRLPRGLTGTVRPVIALLVAAGLGVPGAALARDSALPTPSHAATASATPVVIVATFSILADLVAQVGGDAVSVVSLVPPGGDAHVFRPGPNHAKQIAAAGLVVANEIGRA